MNKLEEQTAERLPIRVTIEGPTGSGKGVLFLALTDFLRQKGIRMSAIGMGDCAFRCQSLTFDDGDTLLS